MGEHKITIKFISDPENNVLQTQSLNTTSTFR